MLGQAHLPPKLQKKMKTSSEKPCADPRWGRPPSWIPVGLPSGSARGPPANTRGGRGRVWGAQQTRGRAHHSGPARRSGHLHLCSLPSVWRAQWQVTPAPWVLKARLHVKGGCFF